MKFTISKTIFLATLLCLSYSLNTSAFDDSDYNNTDSDEYYTNSTYPHTSMTTKYTDFIDLSPGNHVVLRGQVTEDSITRVTIDMAQLQHDDVILYITSPGGDVVAGQNLVQQINYMQKKGRKVHCVADIAASMAFAILQACDERYVTPNSILMQHQMSLGVSGQYFNVKSRMKLIEALERDSTERQASRMGMTKEEFVQKITSDWWLYGDECVMENAADRSLQVGCSNELLTSTVDETMTINTFLGPIDVELTFSACPLARNPLEVNFDHSIIDANLLTALEEIQLMGEIKSGLQETLGIHQIGTWQASIRV